MKTLVLLSGGIDSTTALALELEARRTPLAVGFHYGARHNSRELLAAKAVAKHYGVDFFSVTLPKLRGSSLTDGAAPLIGAPTVVPGRNLILAAFAAHYAQLEKCEWVVLGCHEGDCQQYPDCRGQVWAAFNETLVTSESGVRVHLPFRHRTKADIISTAKRLGVPVELTYSCYAGRKEPCGACGACIEREKALTALPVV